MADLDVARRDAATLLDAAERLRSGDDPGRIRIDPLDWPEVIRNQLAWYMAATAEWLARVAEGNGDRS